MESQVYPSDKLGRQCLCYTFSIIITPTEVFVVPLLPLYLLALEIIFMYLGCAAVTSYMYECTSYVASFPGFLGMRLLAMVFHAYCCGFI